MRRIVTLLISALAVCSLAAALAPCAALAAYDESAACEMAPWWVEDGAVFNLSVGGRICFEFDADEQVECACEHTSYDAASMTFAGLSAGTETVVIHRKAYDYSLGECVDETRQFTIRVNDNSTLQNAQFTAYTTITDKNKYWTSYACAVATLASPGICADSSVSLLGCTFSGKESDSGYAELTEVRAGELAFEMSAPGTYELSLAVDGAQLHCTVKVLPTGFAQTCVVLAKGKSSKLKVFNGPLEECSVDNPVMGTVTRAGKVKAKQVGTFSVVGKAHGLATSCTVCVADKRAVKAVANGYKDMNTKLSYNQDKRMSKKYRDCSSFVSRCYWDLSLKRKLIAIGGKSAATYWALTAADEAQWLNRKGRRVAYKAVDGSKLLPGDLVFFETRYAGVNSRYRHIDHAAMYVGDGLCLDTSGGPKGTIGYRAYWAGNKSVKFIGRPAATFTLDKAKITLTAASGKKHTAKLAPVCAKGKVKFASSDKSVVKVSKKGKVTAQGKGTAQITATNRGASYKCLVTVR